MPNDKTNMAKLALCSKCHRYTHIHIHTQNARFKKTIILITSYTDLFGTYISGARSPTTRISMCIVRYTHTHRERDTVSAKN